MRYETIRNLQIPKIGFGCWSIGGMSTPEPAWDQRSMTALHSALDLGYTHFDTAESYANGHSEELLGRAIREKGVRRADLFITSKVSPEHLHYDDVLKSCDNSLRRLGMDYLDLYLSHWPSHSIKLEESFKALNQLVQSGKVRFLGVSNFNLKLLKQAIVLSETPLLTNQVSYSVPDQEYVKNGVLEYCQQNEILLTAYSPVKRRNIKSNSTLYRIANDRMVTPEQIALAWLVMQPRVITIPMSANPQHQVENLKAADIVLSVEEMEQLSGSVFN
ncbi:MAG: aldo/keto reductase [Anaerolineaceae bacterium]